MIILPMLPFLSNYPYLQGLGQVLLFRFLLRDSELKLSIFPHGDSRRILHLLGKFSIVSKALRLFMDMLYASKKHVKRWFAGIERMVCD